MRACLSCIVSLVWLSLSALGQHQSDMELGRSLQAKQQYSLALYHYNKAAFAIHPQVDAVLSMYIGLCHFESGHMSTAARFFDLAYYNTTNDSIQTEALLWKIKTLIAEQRSGMALGELLQLDVPAHESQKVRYYFYKGVCQFELGQYEASEWSFLAIAKDSAAIRAHFAQPKKFNRPNARLAMVMSALLPGSGQLYAGEKGEAVNSVLINSIFVFYSIRIAQLYSPLDAFIAVLPWFQRYYMGGYNRASVLARERMYANRQVYLREIMREIATQNP